MSEKILIDPFFSIGGVDLSDHVKSVTLNYGADTPELTAGGDDTHLFAAGGLKTWEMSIEFNQDYASGSVDATLFSAIGTSVALVLRPDSAVVGVANPQYTANGILSGYDPLAGSVGEVIGTPCKLVAAGTLARATS